MSDLLNIGRMLEPLRRRVALMVRRAVISLVKDDNPVQVVQLKLFKSECRDGVERLQEYGLSTVPLAGGQAMAISVDGECGHEVVIATDDRRFRPVNLSPGDVILYTDSNIDAGHHIFMQSASRLIRVRAKNIVLEADENITLKAGGFIEATAGGNVSVNGALIHLNPVIGELRRIQALTAAEGIEYSSAMTADGKMREQTAGSRTQVPLPEIIYSASPNSILFLHTHPDNASFSDSDMAAMSANESIREMRVIASDGSIYSMSIGDGERPDWNTIKGIYNAYAWDAWVTFGDMTDESLKRRSWTTEAAQKTASYFKWNFTKE